MDSMEITRENGNIKVRLIKDDYGLELLTMRNGYQWSGQPFSPELAKLTIDVLEEYLESENSNLP